MDLLEEDDYGVVVSDYQMPGMDGLDFLEEVKEERDRDIPFIIFTSKGRKEEAMETINLGAERYLQEGGDSRSQSGVLADAIVQEHKYWRSRRRLKESEREKSKILNSTPEIIAYHDTDHALVWANQVICRGYRGES